MDHGKIIEVVFIKFTPNLIIQMIHKQILIRAWNSAIFTFSFSSHPKKSRKKKTDKQQIIHEDDAALLDPNSNGTGNGLM